MSKDFQILQCLTRLTSKRRKMSELVKPLLHTCLYTEEETLATVVDLAEEGTFFEIHHSGTDWKALKTVGYTYTIKLDCDDYLKEDHTVDTDKMIEYYFAEKKRLQDRDDEWRKMIDEKKKSKD